MRAYKTELEPNNVQRTMLAKAAGARRFAYNWGLARRIEEYEKTGKSSNAVAQHKQLNALKAEEYPWMYEVSKCAPQEALRDLDEAYANFFRRVKAGEKPGFPRFKSKHRDKPRFRLSSKCAVDKRRIRLPNIGWVRLKEDGYIPAAGVSGVRQLSTTIKGTGSGRWFVSVMCEVDVKDEDASGKKIEPSPPPTRTVGIDLGLIDFAVTSDGDHVEHPKTLRKAEKKLVRMQRRVSRRVKRSSNRKKAIAALNRQHFKVTCKRKDFIHNATTKLVRTKPDAKFVVENLSVKNMMRNHKLAKAIADSGWGEFGRQLKYKSDWAHRLVGTPLAGSLVVEADRWFPSSKMCSRCYALNRGLTLKDRTFKCPECEFEIDRDENAAINLSRYEEYIADGVWSPRLKGELPPVRREVTPVERKGRKQPRGSRKETPWSLSSGLGREING